MAIQVLVTTTIAGIILMVMSASFHWTARATMKAEKNNESPWTMAHNFYAMPWLMRLPSEMFFESATNAMPEQWDCGLTCGDLRGSRAIALLVKVPYLLSEGAF